jgi:hypothetical protein
MYTEEKTSNAKKQRNQSGLVETKPGATPADQK